jgi:YkoY family integral membrane protein
MEILLSADNAIVLGLLARRLPSEQRRKALFIGVLSSFVIRGASLFAISLLLRTAWIQLLGGGYLLYLCLTHLYKQKKAAHTDALQKPAGFWKTVFLIELYDLAFAIDSTVVAAAFINTIPYTGTIHPKLWIVLAGALIGMIAVRYAAQLFSLLIESFPRMEKIAYLMIGWIGIKLTISALKTYQIITGPFPDIFDKVFWIVLMLLFLLGFTKRKSND